MLLRFASLTAAALGAAAAAASPWQNWHVLNVSDSGRQLAQRGGDIEPLGGIVLAAACVSMLLLVAAADSRRCHRWACWLGATATGAALVWQLVADSAMRGPDDFPVSTGVGYLLLAAAAGLYATSLSLDTIVFAPTAGALAQERRAVISGALTRLRVTAGLLAVYSILHLLEYDHIYPGR